MTDTLRFAAQPGGVEVLKGEAEIVVRFPLANAYGRDPIDVITTFAETDVAIDLDASTARHLAALIAQVVTTAEAEFLDATEGTPIKLPRTGEAPLKFTGRLLAEASSYQQSGSGPLQNRWHDLSIYRTRAGEYVVSIGYRTRYQGEHDRDDVSRHATGADVAKLLTSHQWESHVGGFPKDSPGQTHYAERQGQLLRALRAGYEGAVAQVLEGAGIEEVLP